MRTNDRPPDLLAGIDNLSLDQRTFDPSRDDIERICRFFAIEKLKHYEKEKGIAVSHSNFFIFVTTIRGPYAIKFYPTDAAKMIAIEYAVNRFLIGHHFPTPVMYAGHDGRPFLPSHDRLATCFSYINGRQAWQQIKQRNTMIQINSAMLSLKNILSKAQDRIPFLKQIRLMTSVKNLTQASRALAPYDQKKMIDATLKEVCRSYQQHQPLFTRQSIHNNTSLTNFLIDKKTVYTLDLSHIREDYALSDLASLVISCVFFDIPATTIKTIVKNHFSQHKITPEYVLVLSTLVRIGLISEYLKNIRREKAIKNSTYPSNLTRTYLSHLSARQKDITTFLQRPGTAYLS